jgi:K+-sensing histidine kinase KdpD
VQSVKSNATAKTIALVASVGALAAVAILDYNASRELVFDQFFLFPVVIAAWFGGRWSAWGMAVVAWAVWASVNYSNVPQYVHETDRYWNWALILFRFLVAGTIVAFLRDALASAKRNLAEKEAALKALQESTAKIRAYEGRFQTICAWTNQIKDGDEWISFPEFLSRHLHTQVTHGISPDAVAKLKTEMENERRKAQG